jgi:hypothetical protein
VSGALKLRAADQEDLAVIAACLQDALVPIGDMSFMPGDRRFVLVANRFRWEVGGSPAAGKASPEGASDASYDSASGPSFERINSGLWFDGVTAVRTKGVNLRDRSTILELLTLRKDDGQISLIFAGGPVILLEVDGLRCFLEDIGEPWPTRWRPGHPALSGEGPGE